MKDIRKQMSLLIDNENELLDSIVDVFLCDQFNLDSPLDKPKIEKTVTESVEIAQQRVDELLAMTSEEITETTEQFNETVEEFNGNIDNDVAKKRNNRITHLLGRIKILLEDTKEREVSYFLEDLNNYLMQFGLAESEQALQPMEPQEWYAQAIQAASDHLQRQIEQYQHEVGLLKEKEETIKIVRGLFNANI